MTDQQTFDKLVLARHPCLTIATFEEDYVLSLLRHIALERSLELFTWTIIQGVRDGLLAGSPSIPDTEHAAAALYHFGLERATPALLVMLDVGGHLKDERTLRMARETIARMPASGSQLILIDHRDELPSVIASLSTRASVSLPDEPELEQIVRQTLRDASREARVQAQLTRDEFRTIVRNLRGLSRRHVTQIVQDAICDDRTFDMSDIETILARKRSALSGDGLLEYVQTPVNLDEIGGLKKLKQWLDRRKNCFADSAVAFGIKPPRGVLMLGVQGAGKSLSAKAVATAWQRPLLRLDSGSLYDRYIGESERRLRDTLAQAERMAPVVLWIDEIEKAFASAASQSNDGGLSRRMFGTLLTWMQEHTAPVFLIATANDIDALPPELLRKGRFDEIFFVDLPTEEARRAIAGIHLKKRNRDPASFDLAAIAAVCEGYSGAEIEQGIVSAMHDAFATKADLKTEHVVTSLRESPPLSVTMAEKVDALRQWASQRCVPAE